MESNLDIYFTAKFTVAGIVNIRQESIADRKLTKTFLNGSSLVQILLFQAKGIPQKKTKVLPGDALSLLKYPDIVEKSNKEFSSSNSESEEEGEEEEEEEDVN
jgi:hypothetical protein